MSESFSHRMRQETIARGVIERFVRAWSLHDVDAFAACFREDGDFVNVLASKANGREAVAKMHKFPFHTVQAKAVVEIEKLELRPIDERFVAADLWWKARGSRSLLGRPLSDRSGLIYFVIDAENGEGQIFSGRNMDYNQSYGGGLRGIFRRNRSPMTKRICVLVCSPDNDSLVHSLTRSYVEGAVAAGHSVELIDLYQLRFDPVLQSTRHRHELEPDLSEVQEKISASQHVALFFPTWWYGPPALLKGFLDRAITPGWAYRLKSEDSIRWDRLLKGKSAHVFYTGDTPPFVVRLFIGDPIRKAFGRGILGYVGMSPVRFTNFGSVRLSDVKKRQKWLRMAKRAGYGGD